MPDSFFIVAAGAFGLLFGSFANVVIWRFPRGESVVRPASRCPGCETAIAWYDNIPVVSYLLLRGHCRSCSVSISIRYPIVEAISGVSWAVAAAVFGMSPRTGVVISLFFLLLVLSAIDLDTLRLPNKLVGLLAVIGVVSVAASALTDVAVAPVLGDATGMDAALSAGAGLLLGGGLSGLVAASYRALRGKQGLGMGDVKLLAAFGLFLGPYVLMALMLGSIAGAVGGIVSARGGSLVSARIPFGPYLAAGAVAVVLVGPRLWEWYAGVAGLV